MPSISASSRHSRSTAANSSSDRVTRRRPVLGTPRTSRVLVEVPDAAHGAAEGNWFGTVGELLDDIRRAMAWAVESGDADIACASWAGSVGSGTWVAASTTPGDGSRRPSHSESRHGRAGGSALAWGGLVGMVHDSECAMEYGAEAVAPARALGDNSAVALATMLHASATFDFFHRTAAATELAEESRRVFVSVGDGWSCAMATWIGGSILWANTDYDAALPELRKARPASASAASDTCRAEGPRLCVTSPTVGDDTGGRLRRGRTSALQQAILRWHAVGAAAVSGG